MGKVITVAIEKGGVGKTTTVSNLAALYGMNKMKTLVIDMDPQGNCTKTLTGGMGKSEFNGKGVFDLFKTFGFVSPDEYIIKTPHENVHLIPCNEFSSQITNLLPIMKAQYGKPEYCYLSMCLGDIVDEYDIILVDTAPAKDYLVTSSLYLADYVIIPFCADGYSTDGMHSVYALIDKLNQEEKANIKILGLLMTKTEKTSATNFIREQLQMSDFAEDLFETEIKKTVAVSESTILSVPVVIGEKYNNAAKNYVALYDEINNRLKKEE